MLLTVVDMAMSFRVLFVAHPVLIAVQGNVDCFSVLIAA
jgi:hypothetical protein